jgi:ribonuclease P/MRP protein subunit RPP40
MSERISTPDIALRVLPVTVAEEDRSALETQATDIYEWLSLARLRSPRIKTMDDIDPWLSRYEAPEAQGGHIDICVSSWQGLISSAWLQQFALKVVTTLPQTAWFCIAATEMSGSLSGAAREVVLLRPDQPRDEYLMWEIQSSE